VYENLAFTHALNVSLNCYGLASPRAIVDGQRTVAKDGTFLLYPELMESGPLFLTANCDTIYLITVLNLADGPMVLEAPPMALGAIDDVWFHWVIDVGFPGPDRGQGGKYLIVGPGYDGVLPESGYYIARSTTTVVIAFMRFFLDHDDPAPVVAMIKLAVPARLHRPAQTVLRRRQALSHHAAQGHPREEFWALTLYDNQTRSMLRTPQRFPRAGSQTYPSPAASPNATARSWSTSDRHSPRASAATGSRPCPAKAGSWACASTARSMGSSTRAGGRARSRK
jgi:hypothetical protein